MPTSSLQAVSSNYDYVPYLVAAPPPGGATSHPRSQSYRPTFRTTRIAPLRREGRRVIRAANHIDQPSGRPGSRPSVGRSDESIISANLQDDPDHAPPSGGATSHPRSQSYRPTFRTTQIAPLRREGRRVIRAVNHIGQPSGRHGSRPSVGRGDESSAQSIISASLPDDTDRAPLSGGATGHPRCQSYPPTDRGLLNNYNVYL